MQIEHHQAIDNYFINAPFPCTDNVTLAYPLYAQQLPELKGANIIDGGMNDRYMVSPPTEREIKTLKLSNITHKASFIRSFIKTESLLLPFLRTPAEFLGGINGLSFADTKKIFPDAVNIYPYWQQQSQLRKSWDLFDYKTAQYTAISTETFQRKVRNFADTINANMVLSFANPEVSAYFAKMPEKYLFDRNSLKNKLVLRKMLKDRMGLNSDALGKMGFTYDSSTLVLQNIEWMMKEIKLCELWRKNNICNLCERLKIVMQSNHKYAGLCGRLIYRIYLLSAWCNKNKYNEFKK